MRDWLVLFVVYASLPGVAFVPFYGLVVYSWMAYMRPQGLAWSLSSSNLSYYVGVLLLVGLAFAVVQGREKLMLLRVETFLLVSLVVWVALSCEFAQPNDRSWFYWSLLAKGCLIAVITTGIVVSLKRLEWLTTVIAMSLGLIGLKYAVFGLLRGGVRIESGPGGFIKDNNGFAAALVMIVPLLAGIATSSERRWLQLAAAITTGGCVITILFTFSRGGLLGLTVVGFLLLLRGRRPWISALVLVFGVVGFAASTSGAFKEAYLQRAETISTYEGDSSAMGRIQAWGVARQVAGDRPFFGVGLGNLTRVYSQYSTAKARVAHNSFFQLLAEAGIPAAIMWALLVVTSLARLQGVCKTAPNNKKIVGYARAFQISIIGYCSVAMFLDLALFDLFYHVVALAVCLDAVAQTMEVNVARQESRQAAEWWKEASAPVR